MSASARAPLGWLTAAAARMCPGCGAAELLPGPRGGSVSRNYYCLKCRQGWNVHEYADLGVIDVDAIGPVADSMIEFYLGVAAGRAVRKAQLQADGLSDDEAEHRLDVEEQIRDARRVGTAQMRAMLMGDGFTPEQVDELFAFAQIVEPSGNVVEVGKATLPELRGIMNRLWKKPKPEDGHE